MRVAICLSGYFRRYKDLISNFNEMLLNPIKEHADVDIFFSTWNQLNSGDCFATKHGALGCNTFGEFDLNHILETYKPKDYLVGEFEKNKDLFNILNYDKTLDLNTLHKDIHNGETLFNLTQYYHRAKANELKCQYEKENGFKYDIVIMMRPDLFFLTKFDITKINKDLLSLRTLYNDAFLVSSSENIDNIANLFNNVQHIIDKYGRNRFEWFELYCPEHFLEYHLLDIGITKEKRVELGEDTFWYYPRSMFLEFCYEIYKKTNQPYNFAYILKYFNIEKTWTIKQ